MLTGFIKTVKDTIAVVEKAFGKTGFIKGVFDTILKVFNIVVSSSSILGQIFGRLLKGLLIPFLAIKEMMKEDRGIGAKIVKGIPKYPSSKLMLIADIARDSIKISPAIINPNVAKD